MFVACRYLVVKENLRYGLSMGVTKIRSPARAETDTFYCILSRSAPLLNASTVDERAVSE